MTITIRNNFKNVLYKGDCFVKNNKKFISFILLAFILLSFAAVPSFAQDGAFTTTKGGAYAPAIIGENLTTSAETWILENNVFKKTITANGNDSFTLSGIGTYKKTGYVEATYDLKISAIPNKGYIKAAIRNTFYSSTEGRVWDSISLIDELRPDNIGTETVNIKQTYEFSSGQCVVTLYTKKADESNYTKVKAWTREGLSPTTFAVREFIPYVQTSGLSGESIDVSFSNIVIKEGYNAALLENITESYDRSGSAEINYNIPEGYKTASLTVGGVTAKSFNAETDAAGAYKTTVALSKLPYWGNVPVVLNVEGEEVKTTAINVVYSNEETVLAEEDFEGDSYTFSKDSDISIESVTVGSKTSKMAVSSKNANIGLLYALSESVDNTDCYKYEFDVYITNGGKLQFSVNSASRVAPWYNNWNNLTGDDKTPVLKANNWYRITIDYNQTDKKVEVSVDGKYIGYVTYAPTKVDYLKLEFATFGSGSVYIDNVKLSKYKKGNKPALASASVNSDNAAVTLTFDSALLNTATQENVKLTANGTAAAAEVLYNEDAKTVMVTPQGNIESKNVSIVLDKELFGTSEDMKVSAVLPSVYNRTLTKSGNTYTGSLYAFADGAQSLGRIYIAVYNGTKLEAVGTQKMQATKAGSSAFTCTFETDKTGTAKMIVLGDNLTPLCGTTGATD